MPLVNGLCANSNVRTIEVRLTKEKTMPVITITVILIICSLISLVAHILKGIPLWIAVLFVIITQMVGVIPVK